MSEVPLNRVRDAQDAQRVLDHLPVQVWRMADAETYAWVNHAFAAFHGRTPEELTGMKVVELFSPSLAQDVIASNRQVMESGESLVTEIMLTGQTGECLLAVTKTPDRDEGGRVRGVVCVATDVTEQRRAEVATIQKEENFRALVETIEDLVVIADENGHLLYANPAMREKLEYEGRDLASLAILDLHPSWVHDEATAIFQEMVEGTTRTCPLPLVSRTGNLLPVETRVWFGPWNGRRCVFGLSRDMRREQESLQKFEALFRHSPVLMAINDTETMTFTDVNQAWLQVLGYTAEDVLGTTSTDLDLFPVKEDKERVTQLLRQYGKLDEVELQVKAKDGRLINGLFSGQLVESYGRRYFLTVMVDITARRRAEGEREMVIQELKGALEQIKTLRGIVPICSKCKKVRDDKGFWQQVEAYITRHTDAHFSHGMCPDCLVEMYDEFLPPASGENKGQ